MKTQHHIPQRTEGRVIRGEYVAAVAVLYVGVYATQHPLLITIGLLLPGVLLCIKFLKGDGK